MRNFNIKPTDERVKYIVNEDKKVVVCVIEHTKELFNDFCNKNFVINELNTAFYDTFARNFFNNLNMPNQFSGVAYCSTNDEWNVDTGKLIAFSRAKDKLNKSFFKRANLYVNTLDKWANEAADVLDQIGVKLSVNTEHRHNLIDSILGPEEK